MSITMNLSEAPSHIAKCLRMLREADGQDRPVLKDPEVACAIRSLIIAIEQLADVVEALANREQGKVIE